MERKRQVAIIGAGMAGLAAARELTAAGVCVTLFEKSGGLGGRVATRRVEGCVLDHGAQNLKPQGSALETVMQQELPTEELVRIEAPVRLWTGAGTIHPADEERNQEAKYAYRHGLTTLPKMLAAALPAEREQIVLKTRIARLEEDAEGITLFDELGQDVGRAGAVILTAPAPQSADLLEASLTGVRDRAETRRRAETLRQIHYNACLTVLLGYAAPMPPPPAYALLAEDRSESLLWLAFEQTKAPDRAPQGESLLIAQLGPRFSGDHYVAGDEMVVAHTLQELRRLFDGLYDRPAWAQVKRWRYSQPTNTLPFAAVNGEIAGRVVVCGDGLRPENGRVHQAYESGREAAAFLLARE